MHSLIRSLKISLIYSFHEWRNSWIIIVAKIPENSPRAIITLISVNQISEYLFDI